MELIKTNEVLGGVINELKLFVELSKVMDPNGSAWELNNVFIEFPDSGNSYAKEIGFHLPIFKNFQLLNDYTELELYIIKTGEKSFELRDVPDNKLITSFNSSSVSDSDTLKDYSAANFPDSTNKLEKVTSEENVSTGILQNLNSVGMALLLGVKFILTSRII
ncbi:MAG: hypothetical protein M5T52_20500 [Ignavibacteriaceae bacterium]|nr:hypothetical protein [Ignavibacteriaceae bacterium]